MLKNVEIKAKSEEEALKQACNILRISEEKVFIDLLEEGELNTYKAYVDVHLGLEGKKYLTRILNDLGIEFQLEIRTQNDFKELFFTIQSEENALLIGKNGKNLEAFQILLSTYLKEFTDEDIRVVLDIGNYKEQRKKQLEIIATKIAKEVAKTKREVKLEPMNSYERRIIHTKLSDWRDVYTESVGEGQNRRLVIKPKKK